MAQCIKRWFGNLVDRAIIDGLAAYNNQTDFSEDERKRKDNLFVAGTVLWFVIIGTAIFVVVYGGAG